MYDLAHRIGMHLGKLSELVYLHSGTKKGAAVLGFDGKVLDPRLLLSPFSRLTPAEIEDCLCVAARNDVRPDAQSRPVFGAH
jgi:hypothetical protein